MANATKQAAPAMYIADHTAQRLVDLGRAFYASPANVEAYRQWHYKKFGYWPEEKRNA